MVLSAVVDTLRKATTERHTLVFLQEGKINLCCNRGLQLQIVIKVDQGREMAVRVVVEKKIEGQRAMGFMRWADGRLRLGTLVSTWLSESEY